MKPTGIAVIGAGNRGREAYGEYVLQNPHECTVVAVAETDDERRRLFSAEHQIPGHRQFESWQELLEEPRLCDAVLICIGDRDHYDVTMKCIERGYHVLLEKPMAVDPGQCLEIPAAADEAGITLVIAHVLRYTPLFYTIRELLDRDAIGRVVTIQHNENVGHQHFAHSYVRGNWRRAETSSPIILAKSCHDMDLIFWFAGARCQSVSSFGRLIHFREENAPPGSTEYCLDGCSVFHTCPFSVAAVYLSSPYRWPTTVVTPDSSLDARIEALRRGPYGRCVYRCDNDVVDNQVVAMSFENGVTASFTLSGFTHEISRTIKLMGTRGEIRAHLEKNEIELHSFSTKSVTTIRPHAGTGKHGGGDHGLMRSFLRSLRTGNHDYIVNARESAEGHLIAFAAEEARKNGNVVQMDAFVEASKT